MSAVCLQFCTFSNYICINQNANVTKNHSKSHEITSQDNMNRFSKPLDQIQRTFA